LCVFTCELRIPFIFVHVNPQSVMISVCIHELITRLFMRWHLAQWRNQTEFNSKHAFSGFL